MNKTNLLQDSISKMKYLNYSNNTIRIYSHYISEFLINVKISPRRLTSNDFQQYIDNYIFSSISQQNQIISSIKFLYERVLCKKYFKIDFTRPRKERKLPKIIDKDKLTAKILNIKNLKHKAILSIAYSTGLRVSEILNLKIDDIDSNRMIINIINAKGRKSRIVPLSHQMLIILRKYYIKFKPNKYLFNGQFQLQYSKTSCNAIIKKYIDESAHMHLLRHSCFTHLLENGTDLETIRSIAGHNSIKTTEIYLHVSKKHLNNVELPI